MSKNKLSLESESVTKQDLAWGKAAVFICTKCQKAIDPQLLKIPGDVAENLKNRLRADLREAGVKKELRVMTSSCLSVCLSDLQAVSIIPTEGSGAKAESLALHPEGNYTQLLEHLKRLAAE